MLGVVTGRGAGKRIGQSERMNVRLTHVMKLRSQCNYTRKELAVKR